MARECGLCGGVAIHELDNPAVRWICDDCNSMFTDHVAFVCGACGHRAWMPKTPENVVFLAERMGSAPQEIMDEKKLVLIPACKQCLEPARRLQLVRSVKW